MPETEPELDVAFLPSEMRETEVAVVVDVLRATSTVTQALAAGYGSVHCAPSIEAARALRGPGRVLAGERQGLPVPGFEMGNSPAALGRYEARGGELVLATTNGTPAIVAATQRAEVVLLGCLLNLEALLAAIPTAAEVTVVCSGTDGRVALEDAYVAGRIVARLRGDVSDAARAAVCVAQAYAGAVQPLRDSADGRMLRSTGQETDIAWCARESVLDLVPRVSANGTGVPVVTTAEPGSDHRVKTNKENPIRVV